jgi:hypothetical protein
VRDPSNGGDSFFVIATLVVLFGVAVATLKWRSDGFPEWQALSVGMSPSTPLPGALPNVISGRH